MIFVFLLCFSGFSVLSSFADEDDFLFDLEEEITCEQLPQSYNTYTQDIQLERVAVKQTFRKLISSLQSTLEQENFSRSTILSMIEELQNLQSLVRENDLSLSNKAYNIGYFFKQCLTTVKK